MKPQKKVPIGIYRHLRVIFSNSSSKLLAYITFTPVVVDKLTGLD